MKRRDPDVCVIRQRDGRGEQVVPPQEPSRDHVLVVEGDAGRSGPANETAVPEADVANKAIEAEIDDGSSLVIDCIVRLPDPHADCHSRVLRSHTERGKAAPVF